MFKINRKKKNTIELIKAAQLDELNELKDKVIRLQDEKIKLLEQNKKLKEDKKMLLKEREKKHGRIKKDTKTRN